MIRIRILVFGTVILAFMAFHSMAFHSMAFHSMAFHSTVKAAAFSVNSDNSSHVELPDISVVGGLRQYEGRYKDIVFRRGDEPIRFEVTALSPAGSKIMVDILRGGTTLATLDAVQNAPEGVYNATWDWKSNAWNKIPDDIPVGEYEAKAKIVSEDGEELASSEKKNFYAIFQKPQSSDDADLKAYLYDDNIFETRDEESINYNYYSNWSVAAQRYLKWNESVRVLNPFDEHLFGIVINATDGEINESITAEKLMNAVSNVIYYDIPNGADIDVMFSGVTVRQFRDAYSGIERPIITGQCLDYANGLTAIYRTIGIPARVATNIQNGGFIYHQWTEAYLENPPAGIDKWYIYDAMDYTDEPHTPEKDLASPATGSAPRESAPYGNNAYEIAVGNQTWVFDDGYLRLNYLFSYVDRGNRNAFDSLLEKCENKNYDTAGCTSDPSFDPPIIDLVLDRSEYRVKDPIKANITVSNTNSTSLVANLNVTINKIGSGEDGRDAFGDPELNTSGTGVIGSSIASINEPIEVLPNSSFTKEYIFSVNETHYSTDTYIAQAILKNESINLSVMDLENFELLPAYEAQTIISQALPDESFTVSLNLTNVVDYPINNLRVEFNHPSYNISGPLIRGVNSLSAGESQILTWNVTPNEIRNKPKIRCAFKIESDNGGNQTLRDYHMLNPLHA